MFWRDIKAPAQLRDREEEIPLCEVDAWADAAATTIAIVVALRIIGGARELGGERRAAGIVIWVEDVRVGEAHGVVVQAPAVYYYDCAGGEEVPVDPIVCHRDVSERTKERCEWRRGWSEQKI